MISTASSSDCSTPMATKAPSRAQSVAASGSVGSAESPRSVSDNADLYKSNEFMMHYYKVLWCSRRHQHDWTECPYAHPGERARRRDLRTHHYSSEFCKSMRRTGECALGDSCPMSHSVFEFCKFGRGVQRCYATGTASLAYRMRCGGNDCCLPRRETVCERWWSA